MHQKPMFLTPLPALCDYSHHPHAGFHILTMCYLHTYLFKCTYFHTLYKWHTRHVTFGDLTVSVVSSCAFEFFARRCK